VGHGQAHVAAVALGGEHVQLVVGLREVHADVCLGVEAAGDVEPAADARVVVEIVGVRTDAAAPGSAVGVERLGVRLVGGAGVEDGTGGREVHVVCRGLDLAHAQVADLLGQGDEAVGLDVDPARAIAEDVGDAGDVDLRGGRGRVGGVDDDVAGAGGDEPGGA